MALDTTSSGVVNPEDPTATEYASAWGITYALLEDPTYGPELKNVLNLLNAKNYSGALKALQLSKFYQNNTATVASRLKLKTSQPGAYADALDKYKIAQKKRLVQAGVQIDPAQLDSILTKSFDSGLDDNQLDASILGSGQFKAKFGGSTLGTTDALKQYANSFGVSYNQAAWDTYSKDLFSGATTSEDVQAKIRLDAASAFPAYAEQINNGVTLDALASAYKSSMANILEIDPDSISFSDPTLRKALQSTDASGKPIAQPLWQFEANLRNDPRWEYTNNARATVDSLSLKVLRDWGFA
jgi:hypothetical protein